MIQSTYFRRAESILLPVWLVALVSVKIIQRAKSDSISTFFETKEDYLDFWGNYNFYLNYVTPVVLSVALTYTAWIIFHYQVVPRILSIAKPAELIGPVLFLILLLAGAATAALLVPDIRYVYDSNGEEIGTTLDHYFRKRYVPGDTLVLLSVLIAYEFVIRTAERTLDLLKTQSKFANILILSMLCLTSTLVLIYFSNMTPRIFYRAGSVQFWGLVLFGGLTFTLSLYAGKYVHPSFTKKNALLASDYFIFFFYGLGILSSALAVFVLVTRTGLRTYPTSFGIIVITALVVLPFLISMWRKNTQTEKKELQSQVATSSAELSQLRAQINPHFLFNALNSLYATALKENSEKTATGIQILGDMMRFLLHENHLERIPFSKEIEYLHNYIHLQRMRIDESYGIEIRTNIQETPRDFLVAPMILIPFIENAFKHGISLRNKSWIFITLTFDESSVYFKVHNSAHPAIANDPEKDKSGIGLENVRKRLSLIYPDRHELNIQASEQDFFISLKLQILSPVTQPS